MKKAIIILFMVLAVMGIYYFSNHKIDVNHITHVSTCFYNQSYELHDKEIEEIKSIFDGKKLSADNLSCGFSEDVSIILDNKMTLCIAQDTCAIVFYKEENKYIMLSESEKTQLYNILKPYGFYFPCI